MENNDFLTSNAYFWFISPRMKNFLLACLMLFSLIACKKDKVPTPKPIPTDPSGYQQYGTPYTAMPATEDAVIYEVNLRAFSSTGNLQGVINRLTEIKALGDLTKLAIQLEAGKNVDLTKAFGAYEKSLEMLKDMVSLGEDFLGKLHTK